MNIQIYGAKKCFDTKKAERVSTSKIRMTFWAFFCRIGRTRNLPEEIDK